MTTTLITTTILSAGAPPEAPDVTAPDAPSAPSLAAGDTLIAVTLPALAGDVAGHNVYTSATEGGSYVQHNESLETGGSYNITGLPNDTPVWVKISAVDAADNESDLSAASSATPIDAPQAVAGLLLYLDPTKTQYITHVAGATSKLTDKVAGIEAAQATGSKQPTTGSATINGHNVLSFDGGDCLQIANLSLPTNITIFVVTELTVDGMLVEHSAVAGAGAAEGFYLYSPGGSTFLENRSGTVTQINVADWLDGGPHIGVAIYDGATSKIYRNGGTANGSHSATLPQADLVKTLNIMARNNAAGLPSTGKLGPLLIYGGALSVANRNLVGSWLATKFGITWNTITA